VLFERRLKQGLSDGSIRLVFRRWRRAQVVGGRRYRSPIGLIDVQGVSIVDGAISLADAHAAGYAAVENLLADLKGPPEAPIYRVELHPSSAPDPREALSQHALLGNADLQALHQKLARLDATGPWTMATLQAIEARPGTRAADLAAALGWPELQVFKLQVRKLKALGLTRSLEVGYRLAPRGEAYLRAVRSVHPPASQAQSRRLRAAGSRKTSWRTSSANATSTLPGSPT
jgi:hypothetical protein